MIVRRDGPHMICVFEYHPGVVAALKERIPRGYRRFDPGRRAWIIAVEHWPRARMIFAEFAITFDDDEDDDWTVLGLQRGAPPELVAAAYRALSKLHHPDVGGDVQRMQRINAAYERLSR